MNGDIVLFFILHIPSRICVCVGVRVGLVGLLLGPENNEMLDNR